MTWYASNTGHGWVVSDWPSGVSGGASARTSLLSHKLAHTVATTNNAILNIFDLRPNLRYGRALCLYLLSLEPLKVTVLLCTWGINQLAAGMESLTTERARVASSLSP